MTRSTSSNHCSYALQLMALLFLLVVSTAVEGKNSKRTFTEQLFEAVFLIGEADAHGVGFLLSCERKDSSAVILLASARHVFDNIAGDSLTIYLRRQPEDSSYEIGRFRLPHRSNNQPLYLGHPDSSVDLAVLPVLLPSGFELRVLGRHLLANRETFREYDIAAGDDVRYLGYPMGKTSPEGLFPLVRAGHIASHPVDPAQPLTIDGPVFRGNSGGPVYFDPPLRFNRNSQLEKRTAMVIGIITAATAPVTDSTGSTEGRLPGYLQLGLAATSVQLLELLDEVVCGL